MLTQAVCYPLPIGIDSLHPNKLNASVLVIWTKKAVTTTTMAILTRPKVLVKTRHTIMKRESLGRLVILMKMSGKCLGSTRVCITLATAVGMTNISVRLLNNRVSLPRCS
jgi:hypothetical protein